MKKVLVILLLMLISLPVLAGYASTVTRYVNPGSSGGDGTTTALSGATAAYASLQACITAEVSARADLVAKDEKLVINCAGSTDDTTAVNVSGFTTDATRDITINGDSAGVWDETKYVLKCGPSVLTINNQLNVTLNNLQIYCYMTTNQYGYGITCTGANGIVVLNINKCIVRGGGDGSTHAYEVYGIFVATYGTVNIRNSIVYGFNVSSSTDIGIYVGYANATQYNNTVVNGNKGFYYSGESILKNNIGYNNTTDYTGTPSNDSTNNLSKDATCPDKGTYYRSKTLSFTNLTAGSEDLHLVSGDTDAIDKGADLSGVFTTDIDGVTRTGTWDLGASEYAGSPPSGWTITASAGTGGSITPSGAVSVDDGDNQAFTITADEGYSIADILVDDVSVGTSSPYTFTNVTEDHTISATFAHIPQTYYMGGVGDDFATLALAFAGMVGGDTLIIRDGTYTGSDNKIWSYNKPPDGSAGSPTTIKAEHDGLAIFSGLAQLGFNNVPTISYVNFEGIKWIGGSSTYHSTYIKFLRCIFEGDVDDGNTVTLGINGSYILVEDCIAYGKGRYKFLAYLADHIVFRRCVARQDYANGLWDPAVGTQPIAVFSVYTSTYVELQNCIAIDGDKPEFWQDAPTEFGGAFYIPNTSTNVNVIGCIALNNAMNTSFDSNGNSDTLFKDCVSYRSVSGFGSKPSTNIVGSHLTVGDIIAGASFGLTAGQIAVMDLAVGRGIGTQGSGFPIDNSIIMDADVGLDGISASDTNCLYNNVANGDVGEDDITDVNPLTASLLYLPRIEASSALDGAGSDSGDIGATILKKYGTSGTLWGETGYATLSAVDLFPFPNEAMIKTHMAGYNTGGTNEDLPRGDRGFCTGNSIGGYTQTLSRYIWEYLGNEIPADIYGDIETESDAASINGVAYASVKSIDGLAIAGVASIQ